MAFSSVIFFHSVEWSLQACLARRCTSPITYFWILFEVSPDIFQINDMILPFSILCWQMNMNYYLVDTDYCYMLFIMHASYICCKCILYIVYYCIFCFIYKNIKVLKMLVTAKLRKASSSQCSLTDCAVFCVGLCCERERASLCPDWLLCQLLSSA